LDEDDVYKTDNISLSQIQKLWYDLT